MVRYVLLNQILGCKLWTFEWIFVGMKAQDEYILLEFFGCMPNDC
jgi:hypothetical protein